MSAPGRWDKRNRGTGQYAKSMPCDACGRPVGASYFTDDEVCGGGDGPGFYLCGRRPCAARYDGLDVEARRELFTRVRAAANAERAPRTEGQDTTRRWLAAAILLAEVQP